MDTALILSLVFGLIALGFAIFLAVYVSKNAAGTERMAQIADAISEGAHAFLFSEYKVLTVFVIVLFLAIGLGLHNWLEAVCFVCGAILSVLAGYFGMQAATKANVRTANAARESGISSALRVAFSGGAVMGLCVAGFGVCGISALYMLTKDVNVIFGFSLGASSIALFARVGGGIYTKAADVGADIVGKVEAGIPEDDPRNPAVIADNVGDNVGDVAGMGADLFESYVGAILSAMTLGIIVYGQKGVIFPVFYSALGLIASVIAILIARQVKHDDPGVPIRIGTYLASILSLVAALVLSQMFFRRVQPGISMVCGLVVGTVIGALTSYYTADNHKPVQEVAEESETGPATTIISGMALGMRSAAFPILLICIGTFAAYQVSGLYGIALAAVGMLSTTAMTVAVDAYGPIADNAGGIAEMSGLDESVRNITDKLDSLGNTTAAMGKGFAIGSAALTALALFVSYAQAVGLKSINILDVRVTIGLLFGGMLPFLFSAFTMSAVSTSASAMIEEVRRQFHEESGILEGTKKPNYKRCVAIATNAALKQMGVPGALAIVVPLAVGFILGPKSLGGLLCGSLVSGVTMAIFMANAGGAWDNAKKFIENGAHGGKNSPAHQAAVVGDTVGDPFKDTSGPSINILIKLMTVISLVFAPVIAAVGGIL